MNRIRLLSLSALLAAAQCFAQSPKPAPVDPLGDIDTTFLAEYGARAKAIAAENPPYVEVLGSNLILHHGVQKDAQPVLPTIYHALKDVAHVPFTAYLRLSPLVASSLSDEQIGQLQAFNAQIDAAEGALQTGGFNEVQIERQKQILDGSKNFVWSIIAAKSIDRTSLDNFVHTMSPLILQNADEGACYQVQSMHAQMMKWKVILSNAEWSRLIAVNRGGHQPRYRNVATQYFHWLFQGTSAPWAYPGESSRVLYVESLAPNQTGGDQLVAVLLDADASRAFFGNEWRMSEDVLSDGAAQCIRQLRESDRAWQSQ
ncbi:MAG TPA: hypothetical protein VKZ53_14835 [Candidatus Angelobacter sp.]|nr:hypothetical protein [Candidatus Angelobacter sp.]